MRKLAEHEINKHNKTVTLLSALTLSYIFDSHLNFPLLVHLSTNFEAMIITSEMTDCTHCSSLSVNEPAH